MATVELHSKIRHMHRNLLSLAFMLTSNRSSAYSLVQDTTVKALQADDVAAEGNNFKAWVFSIMRTLFARNYLAQTRIRRDSYRRESMMRIATAATVSDERPDCTVSASSIHAAVDAFSEEYRVPFRMYLTGYNYQEISVATGVDMIEVKNRIAVARRKMRSQFAAF